MYSMQSVANGGPPPLVTNFWGACSSFSSGERACSGSGSSYGSSSAGGGSSARVLRCFLSLPPLSPLLSPACPAASEERDDRRRRSRKSRYTKSRRVVQGVAARLEVSNRSSTATARAGASTAPPAAPTPEVLPEWFGGLGLDKEEEEDLVAAFVALPEPPPPADADAKLVRATRDLVVSLKEPPVERNGEAELKGGVKVVAATKKKITRERRLAKKQGALKATKNPSGLREEEGKGKAEVVVRLEKSSKAVAGMTVTRPRGAKKPVALPSEVMKTVEERDTWLQERLRFDDAAMTKLRETFPNVRGKCVEVFRDVTVGGA